MFGFGEIKFRFVTIKTHEAARQGAELIKREGFKIFDIREADIVKDLDNSKVESVFILCCRGSIRSYKKFKEKHKLTEIMHEDYKTLM